MVCPSPLMCFATHCKTRPAPVVDLYMVRLFFGLWSGGLVITSRAAESIRNRTYGCPAWIQTTGGPLSSVWRPRSVPKRFMGRALHCVLFLLDQFSCTSMYFQWKSIGPTCNWFLARFQNEYTIVDDSAHARPWNVLGQVSQSPDRAE